MERFTRANEVLQLQMQAVIFFGGLVTTGERLATVTLKKQYAATYCDKIGAATSI
ncbi:hypothetical protein ACTHQ8_20865 [Lysinibacillus odysseyi]